MAGKFSYNLFEKNLNLEIGEVKSKITEEVVIKAVHQLYISSFCLGSIIKFADFKNILKGRLTGIIFIREGTYGSGNAQELIRNEMNEMISTFCLPDYFKFDINVVVL